MTHQWWTGLAPVETAVDCRDERHRLRWSDGSLTVLDHTDPDGERTLAALGGHSCECIDILDAWHRHRSDLDVLLLGSRGGTDLLQPIEDGGNGGGFARSMPARYSSARRPRPRRRAGAAFGWTSYAPLAGGPPRESTDDLTRLLYLPGPLRDRLTAGVIAAWSQRLVDHDPGVVSAMPSLHAALYGRALTALNQWLGPDHHVDITLAEAPAVTRRVTGEPRLELPFGWLRDVWIRGFAVIAGRFCLTAALSDPDTWSLLTVGPDLDERRTLTLHAG